MLLLSDTDAGASRHCRHAADYCRFHDDETRATYWELFLRRPIHYISAVPIYTTIAAIRMMPSIIRVVITPPLHADAHAAEVTRAFSLRAAVISSSRHYHHCRYFLFFAAIIVERWLTFFRDIFIDYFIVVMTLIAAAMTPYIRRYAAARWWDIDNIYTLLRVESFCFSFLLSSLELLPCISSKYIRYIYESWADIIERQYCWHTQLIYFY